MHDRPLGGGEAPAFLGLLARKLDNLGEAGVETETVLGDIDPAPDNPAGLADPLEGAAAQPEVHRRLPLAGCARPSADEMRGGGGAGNQEDPDISVERVVLVVASPSKIVKGVLGWKTEFAPDTMGHQAVQSGAFVHLVEVRKRLTREEFSAGLFVVDRRALGVVQRSLDEIRGRGKILQPLLVLDADGGAPELVGDADGGNVHLALLQHLGLGEIRFLVRPELEPHAAGKIPVEDGPGFLVLHGEHLRVERRLAQAFLEDPGGVEQFVGNDGVVHPHAALVEHPHDRLLMAQFFGETAPEFFRRGGHLHFAEGPGVRGVVADLPLFEPGAEPVEEEGVGEILAPERAVFDAGLGERAVQVEHADQAGPGAAPVGEREDRAFVGGETVQDVVTVLPDGLGDNERRLRRQPAEDFHAVLLAVDEAVPLFGVEGVGPFHGPAELLQRGTDLLFHRHLGGLAVAVCGNAKVSVGKEVNGPGSLGGLGGFAHGVRGGWRTGGQA